MFISGMSGNEIYCLAQKGFTPGEIAVGNSVYSMGLGGALGALGRSVSGGEIRQKLAPVFFTSLYSAFTDRFGIRWMVMTEMPQG